METAEVLSYREEFSPNGLRKIIAMLMIATVTVLPPVVSWERSSGEESTARGMPTGRFAPGGGFLPEAPPPHVRALAWLGTVLWRLFTLAVTVVGLIIYYPRKGFKRYALVAAPILAFFVPAAVALYLHGRSEVFRVEVFLVTLVAAAPAVALYVYLTWRKARRLGMMW